MPTIELKTKIPGPKSIEWMNRRSAAVARGPFHTAPVFVANAKGAVIEDVDGNRLIDFAAGIGVVNVGHTAETVVEAVASQAAKLTHGSFNVTPYPGYIELCERLNRSTPGDFPKKSFLANSGAEAVENAIKIARAYTGKQAVICFDHAFHGRTYMAMSLTSKAKPYRYGFGPFNPEVYRAPFPYVYRWGSGADEKLVSEECFAQFQELVTSRVLPTQTAAVIIEPVLGEGGFLPAPKEFLAKLRAFCTEHNIVLIADEIQTGFGRTGTLFASSQLGFTPDLMTVAKGIAGGMPISAVVGRAEIMDAPVVGGIGGTYGGNPVACAAALAVFDLFEKGDVLQQARAIGEVLRSRFSAWREEFTAIGDVRGLGPMLALEFVKNRETREPHPEIAQNLVRHCYENGLVIMTAGSYGNVVRLLMPLTIPAAVLEEGLAVLEAGIRKYS